MAYLLDANVFIQAKNLHYGFDFCPAFWEWLLRENTAGRVYSIEKVGDEILIGGDELRDWAEEHNEEFFLKPDQATLDSMVRVSEWATAQRYRPAAISAFLQDADYYLVSHALAHNHVVVTHEVPSDGVREVKIPNACVGVGLKCMTPFEMLRKEEARFVLGPRELV